MECKCPMCEKFHRIVAQYEWTGNGIPRIYCTSCRLKVRNIEYIKTHEFNVQDITQCEKCIGLFNIFKTKFYIRQTIMEIGHETNSVSCWPRNRN